MIRKLLVASAAVAAIAAYTTITEPAQASTVISAKARGLSEAAASGRSVKKLNHRINHWAHKKGLKVVRVGHIHTACKKATLFVCTSAARVAP